MRVYKDILGNMSIFHGSDQITNEPAHKIFVLVATESRENTRAFPA